MNTAARELYSLLYLSSSAYQNKYHEVIEKAEQQILAAYGIPTSDLYSLSELPKYKVANPTQSNFVF